MPDTTSGKTLRTSCAITPACLLSLSSSLASILVKVTPLSSLIFEIALENVMPKVEVQPRRRAGSVQMVPSILRSIERGQATALRWILESCEKKSAKSMVVKLQTEILDAYEKKGNAIKKKEELHKLAVNNAMYSKRPQIILNAVAQV